MNKTKKRYDVLTSLRGIAALFVIVSHTVRTATSTYKEGEIIPSAKAPFLLDLMDLGTFGVCLFFVLSGCTLFLGYQKIQGIRALFIFGLRRIMRIYPAFIVSLLFYLFFRYWFAMEFNASNGQWIERQFLDAFTLKELISYLTMTFNFPGLSSGTGLFNNAYWSLPVEFQFYILFPLFLITFRTFRGGLPILLCAIFYIMSLKLSFFNQTLEMVWMFLGGMFCGKVALSSNPKFHWSLSFPIVAVMWVAASQVSNDWPMLPGMRMYTYYGFFGIGTVLLLILTKPISAMPRLKRVLHYYGEISYSTYLWHMVFIGISTVYFLQWALEQKYWAWFTVLLTFIATLPIAALSYQYVEKPGIKLGKRLSNLFAKN